MLVLIPNQALIAMDCQHMNSIWMMERIEFLSLQDLKKILIVTF